jgi:hypothetical protein
MNTISKYRIGILAFLAALLVGQPVWGALSPGRRIYEPQKKDIERAFDAQKEAIGTFRKGIELAAVNANEEQTRVLREAQTRLSPAARKELDAILPQLEATLKAANDRRLWDLQTQLETKMNEETQKTKAITLEVLAEKGKILNGLLLSIILLIGGILGLVKQYWEIRKLKKEALAKVGWSR